MRGKPGVAEIDGGEYGVVHADSRNRPVRRAKWHKKAAILNNAGRPSRPRRGGEPDRSLPANLNRHGGDRRAPESRMDTGWRKTLAGQDQAAVAFCWQLCRNPVANLGYMQPSKVPRWIIRMQFPTSKCLQNCAP